MTDHQQWQLDREEERLQRRADFHKHHPEYAALRPCICNAGDRHYCNCPLATPQNRIVGPGE